MMRARTLEPEDVELHDGELNAKDVATTLAPMPAAIWAGDQLVWVTVIDQRRPELHSGECACDACQAKLVSELPIRFY